MGIVSIIDSRNDSRWDPFVARHPNGWLTHLSCWQNILEKSFQHMKGHYIILADSITDDILAAMPVFEVKSWLTGNRLVSIPYATICDPLVSEKAELVTLLRALRQLSVQQRSEYIEVRTSDSSAFITDDEPCSQRLYKHHYLKLGNDPEMLMKLFHRTCVKQRITRSLRSGLDLRTVTDEQGLEKFYCLYKLTRKRLGLFPLPYVFFSWMWREFHSSGNVLVHLAEHKGVPAAGLLLLKYKKRVSAEFSVIDDRFGGISPNHFLFWHAIQTACTEGYTIFDFGRTAKWNQSLIDFKNRWGTHVSELTHYYYSNGNPPKFNNEEEPLKLKITRAISKRLPDRLFCAAGNMCYRHLG